MSALVVGLSHRTADLAALERLAVPADDLDKTLDALTSLDHVLEAVVVSTCNRVEVYAHVARFHNGLDQLRGWFADRAGMTLEQLEATTYAWYGDRAAAHLFAVASGVDSMIVGEQQIATQVRQASEASRRVGASGRLLRRLFDHSLAVSRRVRTETSISRGASSIVDVGLGIAADGWDGGLDGRTVLIIGAGTIATLAADRLQRQGVQRLLVWNRSEERGTRLASRCGGELVGPGGLAAAVAAADLVVGCNGAAIPVLEPDLVTAARVVGDERSLVLLDLGLPRNVDPACASLPHVRLIDIDAVRAVVDRDPATLAVGEAQAIIDAEALRFAAWVEAVKVEPTIRALRDRAEQLREREVARVARRLAELDDHEREAVDRLTRAVVNRLLHEPTVRLKTLADRGAAELYANALRELFDLDE